MHVDVHVDEAQYLEKVPLVVKVDAQQIICVHREGAILHGAQPANHHGRDRVPRAGVRPRRAERDADHVKVDEVLDLEPHGALLLVVLLTWHAAQNNWSHAGTDMLLLNS